MTDSIFCECILSSGHTAVNLLVAGLESRCSLDETASDRGALHGIKQQNHMLVAPLDINALKWGLVSDFMIISM